MTASRSRRRRSMWIALAGGAASLALVGLLAIVAVSAMADSTAGRDASDADVPPARKLPWTSTALIGLVDDDGVLRTSAVAVLAPSGRGGVLLPVTASADAAAGNGSIIRPLAGVFAVDGPEAWRAAMEQLTGLSFDVAEVADHERFEQLITPLGELPVAFPFGFTAGDGTSYAAGEAALTAAQATDLLSATNPGGADWELDLVRDALWSAVADRVGAGIGSLPSGVRIDEVFVPRSLGDFVNALFAGPVEFRSLSAAQVDPERVGRQMPLPYTEAVGDGWGDAVVTHRRSELLLMFASIAPARMGAPAEGPTLRVVSGFTSDDTGSVGAERSEALMAAIDRLVFGQANIVSVVDAPGTPVPDVTRFLVADDDLIDGVWDTFDGAFGDMQVVPAGEPIRGVDVEVMLGRDFLNTVNVAPVQGTDVAGSGS